MYNVIIYLLHMFRFRIRNLGYEPILPHLLQFLNQILFGVGTIPRLAILITCDDVIKSRLFLLNNQAYCWLCTFSFVVLWCALSL